MMKNLFFTALFFIGLFVGNAQTSWNTNGNLFVGGVSYNLAIGTLSTNRFGTRNFEIIRNGEAMIQFEEDHVILGPNVSTKILIGDPATTTPNGYKLYVETGILTEKVKVALKNSGAWADYVFDDDYKLMPLGGLEDFIKKHDHLPNVPSAEELVKQGLDLGKMQAKQMAKIEELTLHLIEKDKEIKSLQKQVELLSKQVELLLEKQ